MSDTPKQPDALPEPDCWAVLTPNGSKLVSPDEAKGLHKAYPLFTADQLRAALASRDAEIAKLQGWRDAIDEALVVAHIGVATEPYDDLNKLLQWHQDIWLDPAVSSDAAALVEQGRAEEAKLRQGEPVAWEGTEGWEALAWHLCAEENGEEACNELVWEGGPIREPWGDRWLKYEGEAKRMIALVAKHAFPPPARPPTAVQACRPEDRAILATAAGAELVQKAAIALAADNFEWSSLYNAVSHMMARLGADGSIPADHITVENVMDALHRLDAGVFVPGLTPRAAQPVPTTDEPAPTWGTKDRAMQALNSIVSIMGGDNGPSIQLRAWIAAQPATYTQLKDSDSDGEWAWEPCEDWPKDAPLSEGALMGVYMHFDRHADKKWKPAQYLLHFAAAVQSAVVEAERAAQPPQAECGNTPYDEGPLTLVQPPREPGQPLSDADIVRCAVESGCIGTVKMTFDSGPYEITRTSINADRFARAIERLITERMSAGGKT